MKAGTLMDGERELYSGRANVTIVPSEHGLSKFAAGQLLALVGMADREMIGGKLYVTNARAIFSSHQFNRVTGTLPIPTSVVTQAQSYRSGLNVGIEVVTPVSVQRFVSWSSRDAVQAIEASRVYGRSNPEQLARWNSELIGRLGQWRVNQTAEALNQVASVAFALGGKVGPLEKLSVILTDEMQ